MITGQGWEMLVERLIVQISGDRRRTYGRYRVFREGASVFGLEGFICECIGLGDNSTPDTGLRIEAGRYRLSTQFGRYRSLGYSDCLEEPGCDPMPAVRLEDTGGRVAILIHPGHPPNLYLSSVGCLNPTGALEADQEMDFWDSRARMLAIIDDLRGFHPQAFLADSNTPIARAFVIIVGEPA